jgi:hypothetical protein
LKEKYIDLLCSVNGGFVEDLKSIGERVNLEDLKDSDIFLDKLTGDMYKWNEE